MTTHLDIPRVDGLRLDGRGPYDADVVVIGAGPAGLVAATRIRWVKGYHVLPGSVCLVESGAVGGLLRWGSCVLSGPGWASSGEQVTQQLLGDVRRFKIPIVSGRASAVERVGPLLLTRLADGRVIRSLAVVVATGLRPLANEVDYYLRGVRITFKGYEHFPSLLRSCASDADGRGLIIVGNEKTSHLHALIAAHTAGAGPITVLTDGTLVAVLGDGRVEGVRVRRGDEETTMACGAVLMDYNAFELTPDFALSGVTLDRDARGFVSADGFLRTSADGVFAAGDIVGRYAATLPALGDGVTAGLSAYAHAFEKKLGVAPTLFAYAPTDAALLEAPVDLPRLPDDAVPVVLGREGTEAPPTWIDGVSDIATLASQLAWSTDAVREALRAPIDSRTVTVHRLHGDHR